MKKIRSFAPCSVSNVACGFDTFGYAIEKWGDIVTLTKRNDNQLIIKEIKGANLSLDPLKNVATVAIQSLLEESNIKVGFDISIEKIIPPSSGLGSSACSANASVFAANELLDLKKSKKELLSSAMKGEFIASGSIHADNIAPSLLGGFKAIRSYEPELDIFNIDFPDNLFTLIIFPQIKINTLESRKKLGSHLDLKQAREQWGNVAGLTTGLITKDWQLIKKSLVDVFAEPKRKSSIPHYENVKQTCLEKGAVGVNISGSGPTIFAFFQSKEEAEICISPIEKIYQSNKINCLFLVSSVNMEGTKIID